MPPPNESSRGQTSERETSGTSGTSGGLFDAAAAVELLMARDWGDRRDAEQLVSRHGVQRVRDAVSHADFLQVRGEIRKTYRGCVVAFLRDGWQVDERLRAEQRQQQQAKRARAVKKKQATEAEQRRAVLAEQERRDELLWSQLSEAQRALHRSVLARLDEAERRFHERIGSTPANRGLRSRMIEEARRRGLAS